MRLIYVIIVPLIWEGVNVIPSVIMKNNDIHIGFVTAKRPKNSGKRAMSNDQKQSEDSTKSFLDSVVVAIDTGNLKNTDAIARAKKADIVDEFLKSLGDFVKNSVENPTYSKRALAKAKEYDLKPEIVQIRGEKPSLMLNLNSETIVNGLKDILRSKLAHRLVENLSKDAGFLFPLVDK